MIFTLDCGAVSCHAILQPAASLSHVHYVTLEKVWIMRFRTYAAALTINRDDGLDLRLLPNLL